MHKASLADGDALLSVLRSIRKLDGIHRWNLVSVYGQVIVGSVLKSQSRVNYVQPYHCGVIIVPLAVGVEVR